MIMCDRERREQISELKALLLSNSVTTRTSRCPPVNMPARDSEALRNLAEMMTEPGDLDESVSTTYKS